MRFLGNLFKSNTIVAPVTPPLILSPHRHDYGGTMMMKAMELGQDEVQEFQNSGIHKSYVPEFLYRPAFGYPRNWLIDPNSIRKLSQNGYAFAVIQTIGDEVAWHEWDIKVKEGYNVPESERLRVKKFFENPNGNDESFGHLLKVMVTDILEIDAGVWVKAFNMKSELTGLFARDGAAFYKNHDIYGYMGNRDDYVMPLSTVLRQLPKMTNDKQMNYALTPYGEASNSVVDIPKLYNLAYREKAAYFQYGLNMASIPVPFGKDEIVYVMRNPRPESPYGRSPMEVLGSVLMLLVYGAQANLDVFINNNIPKGVLQVLGEDDKKIEAFKERFEASFGKTDTFGNFRKIYSRIPYSNVPVEYKRIDFSPEELQFIQQQEWFTKVFWACFGLTPSEMGFTEDSNKGTEHGQSKVVNRKLTKPILKNIEYAINARIMHNFGVEGLEFKFEDYDLDEDIKKLTREQMLVTMGAKTSEMVAEEMGIDLNKLKASKQEAMDRQQQMMGQQPSSGNPFEDKPLKEPGTEKPPLNEENKPKEENGTDAKEKEKNLEKDPPEKKAIEERKKKDDEFDEEAADVFEERFTQALEVQTDKFLAQLEKEKHTRSVGI